MTTEEEYHCIRCGKQISKEEYENHGGFCEQCWTDEEDETDEIIFG
jgi:DNA-directed RNA polymerase subunit RPC12/RpoP